MKKAIPYIIIIIGLLVIIYPFASNLYSSYWENRMFQEAEALLNSNDTINNEEDLIQNTSYDFDQMNQAFEDQDYEYERQLPDGRTSSPSVEPVQEDPNDNEVDYIRRGEVIGKIEIPSISVNLPLLAGSDAQTLDRGAGQIIGTAPPGEIGNTGIAAHRANRDGRFFYRLNEVDIGDEIIIQTPKGTFVYEVYATKIVEPTDMSVLNRNQTDRVVTLITCHPRYTADYRLIVHGKLTRGASL